MVEDTTERVSLSRGDADPASAGDGDPPASGEVSLGIHGKSASTSARLVGRFALQSGARELVPHEAIRGCLRWPIRDRASVDVLYSPEHKAACYGGLQTCGSVWMCPVCAAKISERRRIELGAGIGAWSVGGGSVALVTYTVRHKRSDHLGLSLDGLLRARSAARSGRLNQVLKQVHGIAGTVRALEVTHGENGWHPHVHELMFLVGKPATAGRLELDLLAIWSAMQGRAGLREVNEHGVRVQLADQAVADYVSKFGHARSWDESHELTKSVVKSGRNGSRTPADLLAAYTLEQDAGAGALWQQYARTFKGRRQLAWSRGMRDQLGLGDDRSDEDLAEETSAYAVLLASLTLPQWRVVVANDARAEVLAIASTGDAAALRSYLGALGCDEQLRQVTDETRGGVACASR